MLQTPVLLLIFNRPHTTAKVFEAIRQAKPKQLFIAADGPRENRPDDIENCNQAKKVVSQIDWECEVRTLFRDKNLGCKKAVISAIDWFFNNVEEGIILEDDCLPCISFFGFCAVMLNKYRCENRIMLISGTNYLFGNVESTYSFYYSNIISIWGWATWKRAWEKFEISPQRIDKKLIINRYKNKRYGSYLFDMLQSAITNKINTWDIQWVYSVIENNGIAISPVYNQIRNIGYVGTHSGSELSPFMNMPDKIIDLSSISFPKSLSVTTEYDNMAISTIIIGDGLEVSLLNKARRLISSMLSTAKKCF